MNATYAESVKWFVLYFCVDPVKSYYLAFTFLLCKVLFPRLMSCWKVTYLPEPPILLIGAA